jgi:hypothetical protein
MKTSLSTKLHTPATPDKSADQLRHEAGHGGSYSCDPATGEITLLHATQGGAISRKHPDAPRNLPAADAPAAESPAAGAAAE